MPPFGLGKSLNLSHALSLSGGGGGGLADTTFDFTSAVPAGWSEIDAASPAGTNFANSGGFLKDDGVFSYVGAGRLPGFFYDSPVWTPGDEIDLEWTFAWPAIADTTTLQLVVGASGEFIGTTFNAQPAFIGTFLDRNFNRYGPVRYHTQNSATNPAKTTNSTSLVVLAGSELTADGVTLHTAGLKFVQNGAVWDVSNYFDGGLEETTTLTAAETTAFELCDRPGIHYPLANANSTLIFFDSVRVAAAGTIYA